MNTSPASFFSDHEIDIDDCFPPQVGTGSAGVRRLGTSIFWAALIVIVAARVAFFQPDLFAAFHDQPPIPGYVSIH